MSTPRPDFLTTKEVAALLRVKERKVYELAAVEAIPVSRATGKLLFPRAMVEAWIWRNAEYRDGKESLVDRPLVLAGSHDPLLEWALRESGSGIATFFDGSLDGIERVAAGKAIAAGMHVLEPVDDTWNRVHVERAAPGLPLVLIEWARRTQGLVVPEGNPRGVASVRDLAGLAFVPRQASAGSRMLLEHLLEREGVDRAAIRFVDPPARNETDVALAIADGKADAGLAIESVARQLRLHFVPLAAERYDLAVWRRDWFEPPMQRLLAFARTEAFARRAGELGGYDVSGLGTVHHNGP